MKALKPISILITMAGMIFLLSVPACRKYEPPTIPPTPTYVAGSFWSKASDFINVQGHSSVVYSGRTWIIGGQERERRRFHSKAKVNYYDSVYFNHVWYTTNEFDWYRATSSTKFLRRGEHTSVVFDDGGGSRMWVIGGRQQLFQLSDVWSSGNGVNWTMATATAAFGKRSYHSSVVFDDGGGLKMWVIGGMKVFPDWENKIPEIYGNDVWSSPDGITWTEVTAAAAFPERGGHTSVVYNNKIWVIGGKNGIEWMNDVWSSADGITWAQVTSEAAFRVRSEHTSLVYDGKIWVIGGYDQEYYKMDVWYSTDGAYWRNATLMSDFGARAGHSSVVYKNKMWAIAGTDAWILQGWSRLDQDGEGTPERWPNPRPDIWYAE